jgi:hypothetical protein
MTIINYRITLTQQLQRLYNPSHLSHITTYTNTHNGCY